MHNKRGPRRKHKLISLLFCSPFVLITVPVCLFTLMALTYCLASWYRSAPFDPAVQGLCEVTVQSETDGSIAHFALAPNQRIMKLDSARSDPARSYTANNFSLGDNIMSRLSLSAEQVGKAPVNREIAAICHAMEEIGHDVIQCRIFNVGGEWFASAMLNVNLWTPYDFYYLNPDTGRLVLLQTFDGQDIKSIHIISAERLRALDQQSIGGWYEPQMPDRLLSSHTEVFEGAARLLFSRSDIFDAALAEWDWRGRRISLDYGMRYEYLTEGYMSGATGEHFSFFNAEEAAAFKGLTNLCMPYEIELLPGENGGCDALLFRFSTIDLEAEQIVEQLLIRAAGPAGSAACERTLEALAQAYGELTPLGPDLWYEAR